jgi:hypothetical protein
MLVPTPARLPIPIASCLQGSILAKEYEKQAKEYEKQGRKVPSGFITPQWFFPFQYNRDLLLATAPLKGHDIEQWAWIYARWAIADASDMCKDSEFTQFLTKADRTLSRCRSKNFSVP